MKDMAKDIDESSSETANIDSFNKSPVKKKSDIRSIENAITGRTTGRNLININCSGIL